MKRTFGNWKMLAAAFLLLFGGLAVAQTEITFETSRLTLHTETGDHEIVVELAETEQQRQRGLMYRTELAPDHGMIFDLGQPRTASMWMANTLIPLDMVFIRTDGTVAGFYEEAEPGSKRVIASREPVKYVLELAGGQAQAYGLKPGDTVTGPALKQ
ncbi:DUF192 domain-containing protein [Martelella mediterranea]|uniref:DUF192 domain-containing protein n=1 Tax=Martelella mediterranea TaxID=293089 RepID=UPI001E311B21|nr:DUF192 domain-containing protein [Martelella mediterranea]MCD1634558.1 DUF192 domain-containing protein [Martelella mediterranea]